jgi:hypothetical protein
MAAWGYLVWGVYRSQRLIQHWNYVQRSIQGYGQSTSFTGFNGYDKGANDVGVAPAGELASTDCERSELPIRRLSSASRIGW